MLARVFKRGDSMAVLIPAELAFAAAIREVEIERRGDALIVRPVARRSLAGITDVLAAFPAGFMAKGRAPNRQKARQR